ncbi:hypothetical protein K7432_007620 [Basidiobolus ranarum]|uniref:FHA domain-containing protein n=1 Tax=Basidiobolus ranarum TaxID=34480 RepID=A0ABR2WT22_9FUNG
MKISDLLLDTNSEVSREAFVDYFNNKDTTKVSLNETTPSEITVKTESSEEFTNVLLSKNTHLEKISYDNTTPNAEKAGETPTKDSIEVIVGSYTSVITMGRGRSATINLGGSNKKVSRKHAVIYWEETTGTFTLNVTGANGLHIDGTLYKENRSKKLSSGNIIDVAGMKYRFQVPHLEYLPSPPFGSPAPGTEAEQSTKGSCVDKNLFKVTTQTNTENLLNVDKRTEKSQSKSVSEPDNQRSKAFRNISPASSICNSSFKSSDSLIDGSSDSELSFDSSDMESSEDSEPSRVSNKHTAPKCRKRGREEIYLQPEIDPNQNELINNIVAAIVFTGKHMLSASEIYSAILTDHSTFLEKYQFQELDVVRCLHQYPFFGHVVRKGKDAGGKPLADLWHYTVNNDPDPERRDTYQPLVKGTRSCTLKDKQYYFKPPPKVPSIKYSTQLPPSGKKRSKRSKKTGNRSK